MKFRNGFVSNSSSSSFIVRLKEDGAWFKIEKGFQASEEDAKKIEDFGFKKTNATSPFDVNNERIKTGEKNKDFYLSMKYCITSNQDEVIYFLVKNNIPFKSSIHYGHEYISYKKDSEYVLKAFNFGFKLDMYGEDRYDIKEMVNSPLCMRISVKQFSNPLTASVPINQYI